MKSLYSLLAAFLLLTSCQQDVEILTDTPTGYLALSSVQLETEQIVECHTRAVAADLSVEILTATGTPVIKFNAGDPLAAEKIKLEAGEYLLKTASNNYGNNANWGNLDKGEPIYYKEQKFIIENGKTLYLNVSVPMKNLAVQLILPEAFQNWFSSYTFTATVGNRQIALKGLETAYFDVPAPGTFLKYRLEAVNQDNEPVQQEITYPETLRPGVLYEIHYSLATQSFSLKSSSQP